ncbi:MAG: metallophosphoesterase [Solirubrobacterales bacterium]|nr:metallophosphoesterase [Solirubrobacterales bacterium]
MRIAVLSDVHGNLPALDAVLAELAGERPDMVVSGGDVCAGPMPAAVLGRLLELSAALPMGWIMGNADREVIGAWDGALPADRDDPPARAARFAAARLDRRARDFLATFALTLAADGVRFCHGSPRSDTEILTAASSRHRVDAALAGVTEALTVHGHTHHQYDHDRIAGAGSVGMPYEGRAGAFWALVVDGRIDLRRTAYDLDAAATAIRATGYPDAEDLLSESLLSPMPRREALAVLEAMASG